MWTFENCGTSCRLSSSYFLPSHPPSLPEECVENVTLSECDPNDDDDCLAHAHATHTYIHTRTRTYRVLSAPGCLARCPNFKFRRRLRESRGSTNSRRKTSSDS